MRGEGRVLKYPTKVDPLRRCRRKLKGDMTAGPIQTTFECFTQNSTPAGDNNNIGFRPCQILFRFAKQTVYIEAVQFNRTYR